MQEPCWSQVEARHEQARLSYNRNKKLWEERTISESEWETAQSAYDVAKAEVTAAQQKCCLLRNLPCTVPRQP